MRGVRTIMRAGDKHGMLTFVKNVGSNSARRKLGKFTCDCGNTVVAILSHVKSGRTRSCGCTVATQGGFSSKKLYAVWKNMVDRCKNVRHHAWERYGGRGIKVCKEWQTCPPFYAWAKANGWSAELQIDRIDNNGDYTPENCRFVTAKENANNRRNGIKVKIGNQSKTILEWAKIYGVSYSIMHKRAKAKNWVISKKDISRKGELNG